MAIVSQVFLLILILILIFFVMYNILQSRVALKIIYKDSEYIRNATHIFLVVGQVTRSVAQALLPARSKS